MAMIYCALKPNSPTSFKQATGHQIVYEKSQVSSVCGVFFRKVNFHHTSGCGMASEPQRHGRSRVFYGSVLPRKSCRFFIRRSRSLYVLRLTILLEPPPRPATVFCHCCCAGVVTGLWAELFVRLTPPSKERQYMSAHHITVEVFTLPVETLCKIYVIPGMNIFFEMNFNTNSFMIVNPHRFSQTMIGSVVVPFSTKNASAKTALIVVSAVKSKVPKKNSNIFRVVAFYLETFVQEISVSCRSGSSNPLRPRRALGVVVALPLQAARNLRSSPPALGPRQCPQCARLTV